MTTDEPLPPTTMAILDATLAVVGRVGLAKLGLEDVAHEAGVSRQTVYRHFGSRDGLLSAVIVREEEALLAAMFAAADGVEDLQDALTVGIRAVLDAAQAHPLMQRLLQDEPSALLPFLTAAQGPVLSIVGPTAMELIVERHPELPEAARATLGDAIGRLVVTYAISPSVHEDNAATARLVAGLVTAYVRELRG